MRWCYIWCLFVAQCLLAGTANSQDRLPELKAELSIPNEQFAPGQQINIRIQVATPSFFMGGLDYRLPYIEGALVLQEESGAANGFSQENGKQYATQWLSYQIYARQQGILQLPEVVVTAHIANESGVPVAVKAQLPERFLIIQQPSEMGSRQGYLVSPEVSINDDWSGWKADKRYQRGDLIERVITIKADDTSAVMIPDFIANVPDGVSLLRSEPQLSSNYYRGESYAQLQQSLVYSVEKPGRYDLGGERLVWWNPAQKERQEEQLVRHRVNAGGIDWFKVGFYVAGVFAVLIVMWALSKLAGYFARQLRPYTNLIGFTAEKQMGLFYRQLDYGACKRQAFQVPLLRDVAARKSCVVETMLQALYAGKRSSGAWPSLLARLQLMHLVKKKPSQTVRK
ncbi:BatD family protein [Polycladidibacter stylochi]|uniref:BatD family protein n=1 Tax=Polycladidibacter stylochi TaxID=1807766 RepID=UPI00083753C7|nr:BatD family protein [Pseudovibrio stylochi]